MAALRSLLFYVAFYGGSVLLVLTTFVSLVFGRAAFLKAIRAWAAWHRVCARWLLGIRVNVEGTMPKGGVLIAMKHESFFEAIDLPRQFRNPVVFAKAELLRIPLWGQAGRIYGLVGVEREQGAKALRKMITSAREQMDENRVLVIFPEGTRVPHGAPASLQSGFAGLYKLLNLPVVPVAVDSGPLYHRRWKRGGTLTYRFCETIPAGLPRDEVEARVKEAMNSLNGDQAASTRTS